MKRMVSITMALVFAFTLMSAFSAEAKKASTAKPAQKTNAVKSAETSTLKTVTGKVVSVNTAAQAVTVAVKTKGKEEKTLVLLNEKTSIVMGSEKKKLEDIKKGDDLTIRYEVKDGNNVAKSIAVAPAKVLKKK